MEWFTFFRGHPFPSHHTCRLNYGHPSRLNCGHPCHLNCGPPSRLIRGHPFPLELELGLEPGLEQVLVAHCRTLGFDHMVEEPHHNKRCQGCNHYWYTRIQTQSHLNCGRPSRLIRGHPFPLELELGLELVGTVGLDHMVEAHHHNKGYQGRNQVGYTRIQTQSHLRTVGCHYMVEFRYHNKHCRVCNHYWYTQLELGLEQVLVDQFRTVGLNHILDSPHHNKGCQGCNH